MGRIVFIHWTDLSVYGGSVVLDLASLDQGLQFCLDLVRDLDLLVIGTEDPTAILGTSIITLSILGRWVMKHEKELDEFLKMFIWICKFQVQDFNVRRGSRTNLAVRWILHGIRIGTHEPHRRCGNRIWKSLLKVLDNVFFCAPVATVVYMYDTVRMR